jgi:hypothetical protein
MPTKSLCSANFAIALWRVFNVGYLSVVSMAPVWPDVESRIPSSDSELQRRSNKKLVRKYYLSLGTHTIFTCLRNAHVICPRNTRWNRHFPRSLTAHSWTWSISGASGFSFCSPLELAFLLIGSSLTYTSVHPPLSTAMGKKFNRKLSRSWPTVVRACGRESTPSRGSRCHCQMHMAPWQCQLLAASFRQAFKKERTAYLDVK